MNSLIKKTAFIAVFFNKYNYLFSIFDKIFNIINTTRFTITIVAPVGASMLYESISPIINEIVDISVLKITTLLNFFCTCIADSVGNIIRLDISSEPVSLIPRTTTIEQRIAKIILYISVFIPTTLAKFSSKVIANILLYENIYSDITITDRIILIITSLFSMERILPNR